VTPDASARAASQALGWRRLLWGWVLAMLAGCATPGVFDSHASYDRTFDTVTAAMAEHKMTFSVLDRRAGTVVGERNGDSIKATLQIQYDGAVRVVFSAQGDQRADPELLQRVIETYKQRMASQDRLLPPGTL